MILQVFPPYILYSVPYSFIDDASIILLQLTFVVMLFIINTVQFRLCTTCHSKLTLHARVSTCICSVFWTIRGWIMNKEEQLQDSLHGRATSTHSSGGGSNGRKYHLLPHTINDDLHND
jgi:hypothetical protein